MLQTVRQLTQFNKKEIDYLFEHARCLYKDAALTLLCAPQQQSFGRALIITPRTIGNAPQRNKIRRQLKAIFYQEKLYEKGVDCAFIIRKPLLKKSFQELRALCVQTFSTL